MQFHAESSRTQTPDLAVGKGEKIQYNLRCLLAGSLT